MQPYRRAQGSLISSKRNLELDFIRGVAILMVISFHAISTPNHTPFQAALELPGRRIGWTGVDLFFVLSGFLVGGILLKEYRQTDRIEGRRFLIRRAFKIWPAYYLFILFELLAGRHPARSFLWANVLNIQNYAGTSLAHTWSLAVEEHFYLVLTLLLAWMTAKRWPIQKIMKVFAVVMLLAIVARFVTVLRWGVDPVFMTHTRLDSLLFGVLLAALFHFYPDKFTALAGQTLLLSAVVVAGLGAFLFLPLAGVFVETIGFTILYVSYGALLVLAISHFAPLRKYRAYRMVAAIGVYSYNIYLWHLAIRTPCQYVARYFPASLQWFVLMSSQFAVAIGVGMLMTWAIEKPFLRIRNRLVGSDPIPVRSALAFGTQSTVPQ